MEQQKVFKIILIGQCSTGKSCLIQRFVKRVFDNDYKPTIGCDFLIKEIEHKGRKYTLQVWDTVCSSFSGNNYDKLTILTRILVIDNFSHNNAPWYVDDEKVIQVDFSLKQFGQILI